MEERKTVICDTSVWYHMAEGKITPDEYRDYKLIGTFMNAYEFSRTPAIVEKRDIWKAATSLFFELSSNFRCLDPVNHMKKVSNLNFDNLSERHILKILRMVQERQNQYKYDTLEKIYDYKEQLEVDANEVMGQVIDFRNGIKNYGPKEYGKYKREVVFPVNRQKHLIITKDLVSMLMGDIEIEWGCVQLFQDTYDEWLMQLSRIDNLKMTNNDWIDVLNLVYVKPGEYYWTKDERKTRNFIKDSGNDRYFVETIHKT